MLHERVEGMHGQKQVLCASVSCGYCIRYALQGVDHSRPKQISRHTPTDQMPRFKAIVRFQVSRSTFVQ